MASQGKAGCSCSAGETDSEREGQSPGHRSLVAAAGTCVRVHSTGSCHQGGRGPSCMTGAPVSRAFVSRPTPRGGLSQTLPSGLWEAPHPLSELG